MKYAMNGVRAGVLGHAKPVGDSSLKPPAFAAMTGAAAHSSPRTGEARPGKGFRQSARLEPVGYARTGRNDDCRFGGSKNKSSRTRLFALCEMIDKAG